MSHNALDGEVKGRKTARRRPRMNRPGNRGLSPGQLQIRKDRNTTAAQIRGSLRSEKTETPAGSRPKNPIFAPGPDEVPKTSPSDGRKKDETRPCKQRNTTSTRAQTSQNRTQAWIADEGCSNSRPPPIRKH